MQEWTKEKPKLDKARTERFFYLEDGEYNKTIKNARKTLEVPMEAALLCKMETRNFGKRKESILPSNHEDHIAVKGLNSMAHHKLVHKFVPMHQAMKIPGAKKAAVDRMCEARKDGSMATG